MTTSTSLNTSSLNSRLLSWLSGVETNGYGKFITRIHLIQTTLKSGRGFS
ncbi:hypothetical protein [Nostoc sp. DedQUE09]|nr:hypothetical protein [Nostoc sp. DedQUE09]